MALVRAAPRFDVELVALNRRQCDIENPTLVAQALVAVEPDVVINCAAWTAVDMAEERRHEAWRVNAVGPAVIAEAVTRFCETASLIHMSTDYVFSGSETHGSPLSEDADPNPRSSYGLSKLSGESALRALLPARALIVRTSWLYGRSDEDFVGRIRQVALAGGMAEVVEDQWGSPTYIDDLAESISRLAVFAANGNSTSGVVHVSNSGFTSRLGLARKVYELLGVDPQLVKPTPQGVGRPLAVRPRWSALSSNRLDELALPQLRDWQVALASALEV